MIPEFWSQATRELAHRDPVMAELIRSFAGVTLVSRDEPFTTLIRSIVGQQISVKAADSVWRKMRIAFPELAPEEIISAETAELRACGLSARKVEYLVDLARHFLEGRIHVDRWSMMSDAEIVTELTAVRGIGVWTAEMFLIFNQLRPDIWPVDDIGLQKAVARHYGHGERLSRQQLLECG